MDEVPTLVYKKVEAGGTTLDTCYKSTNLLAEQFVQYLSSGIPKHKKLDIWSKLRTVTVISKKADFEWAGHLISTLPDKEKAVVVETLEFWITRVNHVFVVGAHFSPLTGKGREHIYHAGGNGVLVNLPGSIFVAAMGMEQNVQVGLADLPQVLWNTDQRTDLEKVRAEREQYEREHPSTM